MNSLDRLVDFTVEIEKMMIEAAMTMHKDNLIERQVNGQERRKLELELFKLELASSERIVALFANVLEKNAK